MINLSWMPILKYIGMAVGVLSLVAYIYVLRADNSALEASVELYKHEAQNNALVANQNAQIIISQKLAYQDVVDNLVELEDQVDELKSKQHTTEIEVVKYVSQLPEGFEKQCLNMPVPSIIGRVQK